MLRNRSIPNVTVIPELAYSDIGKATDWLCDKFGFTVRVRMGDHRAQLNVGDGAIVVTERRGTTVEPSHAMMVRVENVDAHCKRAKERGAHIVREPEDFPYGERQYSALDLDGHPWKFTQSIADVAPEDWGGVSGKL